MSLFRVLTLELIIIYFGTYAHVCNVTKQAVRKQLHTVRILPVSCRLGGVRGPKANRAIETPVITATLPAWKLPRLTTSTRLEWVACIPSVKRFQPLLIRNDCLPLQNQRLACELQATVQPGPGGRCYLLERAPPTTKSTSLMHPLCAMYVPTSPLVSTRRRRHHHPSLVRPISWLEDCKRFKHPTHDVRLMIRENISDRVLRTHAPAYLASPGE